MRRKKHPPSLTMWPRLAMGVLSMADFSLHTDSDIPAWNLKSVQGGNLPQQRYPTGIHQHDHLELCITVQGQGTIEIQGKRYLMDHPAMVILPPGLEHCEGVDHHKHRYATLWFSWVGDVAVRVIANAYQPNGGWSMPWGTILPQRYQQPLSKWADEPFDLSTFELLRATLLGALGELAYQSEMQTTKSQPGIAVGHIRVLRWVRHHIDQNYAQPLSVDRIAQMTCYSPHYLNTLFIRWTGRGIRTYLIDQRMKQARWFCQHTELPIHEIAIRVGYEDPLYFSRAFRKYHGCTPTQSRSEQVW